MAYNYGFPATYQYQAPYQPTNRDSAIIWVQGEAGAKSYLVAPNNTVQLWDSESQTIYLKSADASGMPSMKVLDYTIRESPQNGSNSSFSGMNDKSSGFVTKDEFKSLSDQLEDVRAKVESMSRRRRSENDE